MSHGAADGTLLDRLAVPAVPVDLAAVVGYVAVAVAVLFVPDVYGSPLAVALGLPTLLFAPGYAVVSLLFPGAVPDDAAEPTLAELRRHGLGGSERVALGFGVSVALLPLLGVALAVSSWSIGPASVLASVAGLTVACAVGATIRRLRRPADRRFSVPVRAWIADARRSLRGSPGSVALDVALAAAVVIALVAVGLAVAAPGPGQDDTGL